MDKELLSLKKEVELLRKQKERELQFAQTIQERNKLILEIKNLKEIGKSPSALKSIGKNMGRGLKILSGKLWKATKKASANLSKNSPEFREMGMKKESYRQPYSNLAMNYLPVNSEPIQVIKRKVTQPIKRKQKVKKKNSKRRTKNKVRLPRVYVTSGVTNPNTWEVP
jgi:hypothetical protein